MLCQNHKQLLPSHKSRRDVKWFMRGANVNKEQLARQMIEQFQLTPLLEEVLAEPDEIDF